MTINRATRIVMAVLASLTLFSFAAIRLFERQRLADELDKNSREMMTLVLSAAQQGINSLHSVSALFSASEVVNRTEFAKFSSQMLATSQSMINLAWAPRIDDAKRAAFERGLHWQGQAGSVIFELDPAGGHIPAATRAEYFPLAYYEPASGSAGVIGFDLGSEAQQQQAIRQARDSGQPAITPPLALIQDAGGQPGILMLTPIYISGAPVDTVEQRRNALKGFAAGAYYPDILIERALAGINPHDVELYIYDVGDPVTPQFIAFYPSISGPQALPASDAPAPQAVQSGVYLARTYPVADRSWLVIARPGPARLIQDSWMPWAGVMAWLLVIAGFLTYEKSRQLREALLEHSEAEFRALADYALVGIARLKRSGQILYANQALAEALGLAGPQALTGQAAQAGLFSGQQFAALLQQLDAAGQVRNQEIEVAGEQPRSLLFSASLREQLIFITAIDITERYQMEASLRERVKELTCVFNVNRLSRTPPAAKPSTGRSWPTWRRPCSSPSWPSRTSRSTGSSSARWKNCLRWTAA
ncbi:MAG: CHASE domain-containing protein [Chloroflexota bacterium]